MALPVNDAKPGKANNRESPLKSARLCHSWSALPASWLPVGKVGATQVESAPPCSISLST